MKAKKLECIDGETLMDMRLESIRYCVEGLLPQGVAMIGGVPKTVICVGQKQRKAFPQYPL